MRVTGALFFLVFAGFAQTLPPGVGRESFRNNCGRCHTLSNAIHQGRSREEWKEVVDNMIAKGAKIKPRVASEIVDYLSRHFARETR